MTNQQYHIADQSAGWDMVGTIAKELGVTNPTMEQRKSVMKMINRQMLFMTRQTFGYFFALPGWGDKIMPVTDIEKAIKGIYQFNSVDE